MQTTFPVQALTPQQAADNETPLADFHDMRQTGEEAARAVARMRRIAIDNWDQVAHFTQAALVENGISYREQEFHTGVGASTVYRMALGNAVGVRAVQQFAAFAAYGSRREETKDFWAGVLSRFNHSETHVMTDCPSTKEAIEPAVISPDEIASLYAQLVQPSSKKAVTDLLHTLQASEAIR